MPNFLRFLPQKPVEIDTKTEVPLESEGKEVENKSETVYKNPTAKKVYAFVDNKCVGIYDSISLCATTLGMSRAMVKKAIDNNVVLENGFLLKLNN